MNSPRMIDWLLLLSLTVMWGSAFMFTKIAVSDLTPAVVVTGRLIIAAIFLIILMLATGRDFPRSPRLWGYLAVIAVIGNVVPFYLISWGQKGIDSGVAGILMALMPLMTLVLAHFFLDGERMTWPRILGFFLGFTGVLILIGPAGLRAIGGEESQLLAIIAVLSGALCYGASAVISRLRPKSPATESAAGMTVVASVVMLPVIPLSGGYTFFPGSYEALSAVVVLGLFSTALPSVVYFRLIESRGPNFVSFLNYLIPIWAVILGMVFLGERITMQDVYALVLILSGIAVAQRGYRPHVVAKNVSKHQ